MNEFVVDYNALYNLLSWTFVRPLAIILNGLGRTRPHATFNPPSSFLGPTCMVGVYASLLWLAKLPNETWTFAIILITCSFQHLTARVFVQKSEFGTHYTILGYCICPLIFVALFVLLIKPPLVILILVEVIGVTLSSTASYLAYHDIYNFSDEKIKDRHVLLLWPILLMNIYFVSLLPAGDE